MTEQASDGTLAASVGLTDADLVEMYRYVALARALDERMWILNRAGPDPVRDLRPGPRGRPGRRSPGRSSAATTGSRRSTARSRRA